jgi:hypothetical protein
LRNDTPTDNHWIRLALVGTVSNRDAIGALVIVKLKNLTRCRQRKGGASLESSHDPRLLIGLGRETEARTVTIRWPSGRETVAEHLAADQSYEVVEPPDTTRQGTRDTFRVFASSGPDGAVPRKGVAN